MKSIIKNTMQYKKFKDIFNDQVFGESKSKLLEKIGNHPQRYVGIFRATTTRTKIIQNLTQSMEIRFGDAFEEVVRAYFEEQKYQELQRSIVQDKKKLLLDQLIQKGSSVIFIEQKIRDDHDSTKKKGQINNFKEKIKFLIKHHNKKQLQCFFWFIDPGIQKNKNYYLQQIEGIRKKYNIHAQLVYEKELFDAVGMLQQWNELIKHLKQWRQEIPELPNINFDSDPNTSFEEIKNISPSVLIKLCSNPELKDVLTILFPTGETLEFLRNHFQEQQSAEHQQATQRIDRYLQSKK